MDEGGTFLLVLLFNVIVFTIFMVFFLFYFRLRNSGVYFPKRKHESIFRTPTRWIWPLLRTPDIELQEDAGILAVLLLRYELYLAALCILFTLLGIIFILPTNVYHGLTSGLYSVNFLITTGTTVSLSSGSLWIHFIVFMIMLLSSTALIFLYHYKLLQTLKSQRQKVKINYHTVKFRRLPKHIITSPHSSLARLSSSNIQIDKLSGKSEEEQQNRNQNYEEDKRKSYALREYERMKDRQAERVNDYTNSEAIKEFFDRLFPQFADEILSVHIAYDLNDLLTLKQKKLEFLKKLDREEYLHPNDDGTVDIYSSKAYDICSRCCGGRGRKRLNAKEYYSNEIMKISELIKEKQRAPHDCNNGIAFITFRSIVAAQQFTKLIQLYSKELQSTSLLKQFTRRINDAMLPILNSIFKVNSPSSNLPSPSDPNLMTAQSLNNPLLQLIEEDDTQLSQFISTHTSFVSSSHPHPHLYYNQS